MADKGEGHGLWCRKCDYWNTLMCPCIKLAVTTALVLQSTAYNIFVIWRWMKKYMWSWCFGRSTRMSPRGKQTERHRSVTLTFVALLHQQIVYKSCENDRKQNTASQTWYPPFHLDFSLARNRTLSYQNLFIVGSTLFPRTTRYHKCCKDVL